MNPEIERIKSIKTFSSLVKYLREELDWQIEDEDIEDLTFEYEPEELGLDKNTAVKVKEIKQLRPMVSNQPWGIFYISFEPKKLPIVALRRILRSLVIKKRESANRSQMATWNQNDLLFISSYGEDEKREITFAHFSDNKGEGNLPILKVLGWSSGNSVLRLQDTYETLKERLRWVDDETNIDAWREQWASAFKLQYGQTIRTSKELAIRLADLASVIRNRVNDILASENEEGEWRKLYEAFKKFLIHDLKKDDFADMYAQTISYGLLTAGMSRKSGELIPENLVDMIPSTNPFLKELMQTFINIGRNSKKIDWDEAGIYEVIELLKNADLEQVVKDFNANNPKEDPVIHFYEDFLKEYDSTKRTDRGVFYTPKQVVSFIVRSVHEILKNEFGLEDGLADTTTWGEMKSRNPQIQIPKNVSPDAPFVQILDPATGTGTFLIEVIDLIHKTLEAKWQKQGKSETQINELWSEYVPKHLLPRMFGFELMMAPYVIAHMKISLKLTETRCYMSKLNTRAQIYLTNTLEEPKSFPLIERITEALAHEAEAANKVKKQTPITVVIGNPPYSGHSKNNSDWIYNLLRGKDILDNEETENYFEVDGQSLNERNPKWLNDDYVKFIRYSQRVNEKTGIGLLAFISNNGYLDNPTFRGMRQSLTATYNKIYLLDLHGSAKKKEKHPDGSKDENVFDIEQGVGIGAFVSTPDKNETQISHAHLFGVRENPNGSGKYQWLLKNEVQTIEWTELELQRPFYLLIPQDATLSEEFHNGWKITEAMQVNSVGIVTSRDGFVFDFDESNLRKRIKSFADSEISDKEIKQEYLSDKDKLNLKTTRKIVAAQKSNLKKYFVKCLYRPFDKRNLFYHDAVIERSRHEVMQHFLNKENCGIITTRQQSIDGIWSHVGVSDVIIESCAVSNKTAEINYLFPLYLYPTEQDKLFGITTRTPNFSDEFIKEFSEKLNLKFEFDDGETENPQIAAGSADIFTPEDVFHYAYAVFHSPTYRSRYAEFLKIDFPRLPLTTDTELFRKLAASGAELVRLHLLENVDAPEGWTLRSDGSTMFENRTVASGFPKKELFDTDAGGKGKVYINKTAYFAPIAEEVWNFHIGGYQVCHKWLKDRKDRELSEEDIQHYGKITVALRETIRLMNEIDAHIEDHGGFPIAGSQE